MVQHFQRSRRWHPMACAVRVPQICRVTGKTRAVTLCDRLAGRKVLPIWFGAAPRCWDPKSRHLPGFEGKIYQDS